VEEKGGQEGRGKEEKVEEEKGREGRTPN